MPQEPQVTIHEAIAAAEARAQEAHDAGICHLDEFSCSACERENGA